MKYVHWQAEGKKDVLDQAFQGNSQNFQSKLFLWLEEDTQKKY
jgi:hypothetical protein